MHQEVYHSFPELEYGIFQTFTCKRDCLYIVNEVGRRGNGWAVCKKTQGFVGFNPLGSEEANISKTETE